MRADIASRTKRGISFILASIVLWIGITVVWVLPIENISMRNLLTFCCSAPLMPLAFLFSKVVKAEFSIKGNPLNNLGILFSVNQMLYLLIAIWAFSGAPEKMVMIIAIIFGAHLLPYSWLYNSKAYLVMSIIIPVLVTVLGWDINREQVFVIPCAVVIAEIVFTIWLVIENSKNQAN
ncbi:MAG: DUF7010 family protein [Acidobacteriota bacterium]